MSQEQKKETMDESKENLEKTILEEKSEIVNKPIQREISYTKGLEAAVEQIRLFEEHAKKVTEMIDVVSFSSSLENIKKFEESTRITVKVMEDSVKINIINTETSKYLDELKEIYFELNQEIVDIPNVSIVSQGALINDMNTKMKETIRAQNAYIESLEKELTQKEDEIRQLRTLIEEKKKKDEVIN
jgi:vacuolar-type H+-ATPase subunit I/STV1